MDRPKRKERPLIIIDAHTRNRDPFWQAVIDGAGKLEWQLFNIHSAGKHLPFGMIPIGGISSSLPDDIVVEKMRAYGCRFIVRHGMFSHRLDHECPAVIPDRRAIGKLAAEHFAARGFKHVGDIMNVPLSSPNDSHRAFSDRASELGMKLHLLQRPQSNYQPIYEELGAWLRELPKPIGILAYTAFLANKIYLAAQEENLMIPQEVGILSTRDSHDCEFCPVPISAIELDRASAGREIVNLLKRMMDGDEVPASTTIPPKRIVLRQSTDVLAVPDLIVAKALSYIWEYYAWPLTGDDIAMEVKVSRSTLERRFRRHLGHSVNEELRRKRLEQCCELLKTTSKNMDEVMHACGFACRPYFHRIFRKEFGMTPGQYRRRGLTGDSLPDHSDGSND